MLRVARGIRTALVLFVSPRESLIGSYMKLVRATIHFGTFLNNSDIGHLRKVVSILSQYIHRRILNPFSSNTVPAWVAFSSTICIRLLILPFTDSFEEQKQ